MSPGGGDTRITLPVLRERIEAIDQEIVWLLAERVALAQRVGPLKQAAGKPTLDPQREVQVVRRVADRARELGLPEEDIRQIFWTVIGLSRRVQRSGSP